jgi:arylsulfatase A-like enzyme
MDRDVRGRPNVVTIITDQQRYDSESPFFLQIGFPGPHPPYDPPARLQKQYEDIYIPVAEVRDDELANQPSPHAAYRQEMIVGNHDAVRWHERPTREQLQVLRRHYAANVTLIDEQIGRILDVLERKGYLENAIVLLTSDHGGCLGDHDHIQKWTMYDVITRTPTIIWAPGHLPAGRRVDELIQQMDLVPMLFELAGLEPPQGSSVSALPLALAERAGRKAVFAEHSADNILKEIEFITMVRTRDWKLVHYLDQPWGEMYDLRNDPGEMRNLWNDLAYDDVRRELLGTLRDWRIRDSL